MRYSLELNGNVEFLIIFGRRGLSLQSFPFRVGSKFAELLILTIVVNKIK